MDYASHYARLIERARARATARQKAKALLGYVERHRVLPGCMGGDYTPGNYVFLTGSEHYVAHQLLVKMYPQEIKLVAAAMQMAKQCSGNKAYGWLRERRSKMMKGHRSYGGAVEPGFIKTPEHREKIAAAQRGIKRKPLTAEHRQKLSEAHRGKPHSAEHLANLRASLKVALAGNTHGQGKKHPPRSAETLLKMSLAHIGKKMPPRTPEHCLNISLGHQARRARLQEQSMKERP